MCVQKGLHFKLEFLLNRKEEFLHCLLIGVCIHVDQLGKRKMFQCTFVMVTDLFV